ncbi:nitric oxide associated protein 1 [Mactra antiquata]
MFCLRRISQQAVTRLSPTSLECLLGLSSIRCNLSKTTDLKDSDKREITDSSDESENIPLAMRYLTDFKSSDNTVSFAKTSEEIEEKLEDIKFDIENLKKAKAQHLVEKEKERIKQNEIVPMSLFVGTPDRLHTPSTVPCGGCGAFLHCNDSGIPGYVPQEVFKGKSKKILSTLLCQRCTSMQSGAIVKLEIDKKSYANVVKSIKKDKALVIMVVDVTDMANSIIPEFLDTIGSKRPLFIVGNKIDLIPKDEKNYLKRILNRLRMESERAWLNPTGNNIKYTCLVSAKTGYGIEELINHLIGLWGVSGNVYMVGTTNCGKSTLFNQFLNSDYCKHSCRDLTQRATVSRWPGTTLNLIGFPIIKPYGWKMFLRTERLKEDRLKDKKKILERNKKLKQYGGSSRGRLIGTVGMTDFRSPSVTEEDNKKYETSGQNFTTFSIISENSSIESADIDKTSILDLRKTVLHEMYPKARWAYDTPGMLNPDQMINYLTGTELSKLFKRDMIRPRVFVLRPGHVMFITGLARIDYLEGGPNTFFTVHTNHFLPVHIVNDTEADDFYKENVNTDVLQLPLGSEERLDYLPSLCGREFFIHTQEHMIAAADLQLSSIGWVSFAGQDKKMRIRAYTPAGRGMCLRTPALLPHIFAFKGERISETNKGYLMRRLKL